MKDAKIRFNFYHEVLEYANIDFQKFYFSALSIAEILHVYRCQENYWGHSIGPLDNSNAQDCVYNQGYTHHNPDGMKNAVTDNVIYDPWSQSEAPCDCPEGDSDGVPDVLDDCPTTPANFLIFL